MVEHNLPRPGGKPVPTHYGSCWSATLNPTAKVSPRSGTWKAIWLSGTKSSAVIRICTLTPAASGGNRNDLETLRRSVPLLRSDCFTPAEAQQAAYHGPCALDALLRLGAWVPATSTGTCSCIFPASRIGMDTRKKEQDYALLKTMMAEFHEVEKYLLGDFYPLTAHSVALDVWVAWQFDRPELGRGHGASLPSGRKSVRDGPFQTPRPGSGRPLSPQELRPAPAHERPGQGPDGDRPVVEPATAAFVVHYPVPASRRINGTDPGSHRREGCRCQPVDAQRQELKYARQLHQGHLLRPLGGHHRGNTLSPRPWKSPTPTRAPDRSPRKRPGALGVLWRGRFVSIWRASRPRSRTS